MSQQFITIEPARIDQPEAEVLTAELHQEGLDRYEEEHAESPVGPHDLSGAAGGVFLLARIEGRPVGCGALRRHDDDTAEVKRMYVVPDARRRGVARVVLAALEAQAGRLGYRTIVLETGVRQPEAVALYESHGYSRRPAYDSHTDHPLSICMTKRLPVDPTGSRSSPG